MSGQLTAADLRFVNLVASRRYARDAAMSVDEAALAAALAEAEQGTPFTRAATLTAGLVQRRVFGSALLPTAMLALHCALALEGFSLLAPQGVAAGMIRGLAEGGDAASVAGWLQDRAVSTSSS